MSAYAAWSVVFGEQPSSTKWNILGTNDAYFDSLIGSGTAWSTWSPSLSNMTLGNGTVTAKYQQFGKIIHFSFTFVLGSTSAMGTSPTFTLPANAASTVSRGFHAYILDAGVSRYGCFADLAGTNNTIALLVATASGSFVAQGTITSGVPMTWGTSDELHCDGVFEGA